MHLFQNQCIIKYIYYINTTTSDDPITHSLACPVGRLTKLHGSIFFHPTKFHIRIVVYCFDCSKRKFGVSNSNNIHFTLLRIEYYSNKIRKQDTVMVCLVGGTYGHYLVDDHKIKDRLCDNREIPLNLRWRYQTSIRLPLDRSHALIHR